MLLQSLSAEHHEAPLLHWQLHHSEPAQDHRPKMVAPSSGVWPGDPRGPVRSIQPTLGYCSGWLRQTISGSAAAKLWTILKLNLSKAFRFLIIGVKSKWKLESINQLLRSSLHSGARSFLGPLKIIPCWQWQQSRSELHLFIISMLKPIFMV